jgi:thiol-disulfide isomerase/thioredoxin
MSKKWITKSNIGNALFFLAMMVLILNNDAKSWVMQRLMQIGFFQPEIHQTIVPKETPPAIADVQFIDVDGQRISLSALKGKVVFINFWATWCLPCIAEMPSIHAFYQKFKDNPNVVFLMVDVDGNFKKSEKFMQRRNFDLKVWNVASAIPETYLSNSIPTTIILDKQGQLIFRHEGGADYKNKDFQESINKLASD